MAESISCAAARRMISWGANNNLTCLLNMKRLAIALFTLLPLATMANDSTMNRLQARAQELIQQMTLEEKCAQLMNSTPGIERLGIRPYDYWNEGLHGVGRSGRATVYPEPIGLGATFDPELVERIGDAVAEEGRAKYCIAQKQGNYNRYSGLTYWSPNVNIFRDPRWGRGMETYGEDPYLTGQLGVAYVHGLQGNDPVYLKTSACAKHFAVHSGPESTRHEADIHPSMRDLYETYLPAFRTLVEGGVESVMMAYNAVNESPCSSNIYLMHLLRKQWGFNGHIVSDCGAVDDIYQGHGVVPTAAEASALAIKAGLNLECGSTFHALGEALEKGLITEQDIDKALLPLLLTRLKLGIIDQDPACPYNNVPEEVICSEAHTQLALRAAKESMVLLKNTNGLLPLRKDTKRIYITGEGATEVYNLMGNYYGLSPRYTCYLQGIINMVSNGTSVDYRPGCMLSTPNSNDINWAIGDSQGSEITIVVLGNNGNCEGEEGEAIASPLRGDRAHLRLPEAQLDYLRKIREGKKEGLILVLTGGSPIDMTELYDLADAIIMTWYAGQEGGLALGQLLFGDDNFSGRLPITFPRDVNALPPFDDYTMQGRTYKYMRDNIFFPFGYGLTYSKVRYLDCAIANVISSGRENVTTVNNHSRANKPIALKAKDLQTITCRVTLRNEGKMAVEETLQAYVRVPGADAPLQQLAAFARCPLAPGEEKTFEIRIPKQQLLTVNAKGESELRKGEYRLSFAAAAPSERSQELGVEHTDLAFTIK